METSGRDLRYDRPWNGEYWKVEMRTYNLSWTMGGGEIRFSCRHYKEKILTYFKNVSYNNKVDNFFVLLAQWILHGCQPLRGVCEFTVNIVVECLILVMQMRAALCSCPMLSQWLYNGGSSVFMCSDAAAEEKNRLEEKQRVARKDRKKRKDSEFEPL